MKKYKYIINDKEFTVTVGKRQDGIATVTVNDETYDVKVVPEQTVVKKTVVKKPATPVNTENKNYLQDALRAPIPGTIVDIFAKEGDKIKEGDTILVLEAMKMNNNLTADKDGVIKEILVQNGETVKENTALVTFE
ncbi:MAG: biotin/lipoyl-binding protein [Prevotella sp.]|nr:biotin/lipoyl-binding protein [Prevotella sp.]